MAMIYQYNTEEQLDCFQYFDVLDNAIINALRSFKMHVCVSVG